MNFKFLCSVPDKKYVPLVFELFGVKMNINRNTIFWAFKHGKPYFYSQNVACACLPIHFRTHYGLVL